jgi:hypothetical protein
VKSFDHRFGGLVGFGQHHAQPLGAFQQFDDQRRTAHLAHQVLAVFGIVGKSRFGHAQSGARKDLHAAQLVARAHDGLRGHGTFHFHHLKLAHHRRTVKGYRCADTGNDGIEAG